MVCKNDGEHFSLDSAVSSSSGDVSLRRRTRFFQGQTRNIEYVPVPGLVASHGCNQLVSKNHGFGFVYFIFAVLVSRLRLSGFGFAARLWLHEFGLASFRRRWFVLSLVLSLLASVALVFNFMIAALRVHVAASASRLQFYGFGFAALAS